MSTNRITSSRIKETPLFPREDTKFTREILFCGHAPSGAPEFLAVVPIERDVENFHLLIGVFPFTRLTVSNCLELASQANF